MGNRTAQHPRVRVRTPGCTKRHAHARHTYDLVTAAEAEEQHVLREGRTDLPRTPCTAEAGCDSAAVHITDHSESTTTDACAAMRTRKQNDGTREPIVRKQKRNKKQPNTGQPTRERNQHDKQVETMMKHAPHRRPGWADPRRWLSFFQPQRTLSRSGRARAAFHRERPTHRNAAPHPSSRSSTSNNPPTTHNARHTTHDTQHTTHEHTASNPHHHPPPTTTNTNTTITPTKVTTKSNIRSSRSRGGGG